MKEKGNLGWDGSLAAPPSCASASRFTRLGSSPSSCFLYPFWGKGCWFIRGHTMVAEAVPW